MIYVIYLLIRSFDINKKKWTYLFIRNETWSIFM